MALDKGSSSDVETKSAQADAADSHLLPCPKADWVHKSFLDEYLKLSVDPKTNFKLDATAYDLDFYKLDNGINHLNVDVHRGKDPHKLEDVSVVGKDSPSSESDFYRDGHRWRATFQKYDPVTDSNIATGRADFAPPENGQDGHLKALSGGMNDYRGRNVFFSSKFDEKGQLLEFNTVKSGSCEYTPDVCKE